MQYKIGDKVTIRSWNEMEKQFGLDKDGDIKTRCCFTRAMRQYCGKEMTIVGTTLGGNYTMRDNIFIFSEDAFEKKRNQKIVITSDGIETLARLYEDGKVVKSATAKCSPEDEFDFSIGARLAFDRLLDEEKKEQKWRVVNRPAKKGDYIRLVKSIFTFDRIGDILKVFKVENGITKVKAVDHPRDTNERDDFLWNYLDSQYEVVEPAETLKEPKYYNGKVVCVEAGKIYAYTVGKIYEFKDGRLVNDNGCLTPETPVKTLDEWNKGHTGRFAKFIPLVEETKGE